MKLEVTTCHSILETCFESIGSSFSENILIDELKRRMIVFHSDLEDIYEGYFKANRADLIDIYYSFVSSILYNAKHAKLLDDYSEDSKLNAMFAGDKNSRVLANVCNSTEDRIILSGLISATLTKELEKDHSIYTYTSMDIVDTKKNTILNQYRLPLFKRIPQGANSMELGKWLGRFLKFEKEITVIDNHLYENADNFYNYFLNHVDNSTRIKIITKLGHGITSSDIINKFKSPPFTSWNIDEIHLIRAKRQQHARNIITDNFIILIDKGMAVFGTGHASGLTDQSDISIHYKESVLDYSLPTGMLKIV